MKTTTTLAIEILKANSEVVWNIFNNSPYSDKQKFAQHAIKYIENNMRFEKNGNMPVFVINGILHGYTENNSVFAIDKKTEFLRKKYAGTSAMAMV